MARPKSTDTGTKSSTSSASGPSGPMFKRYKVALVFDGKLAAGLPKDPESLLTFLTVRAPEVKPDNGPSLEEIEESTEVFEGVHDETSGITTTFCMRNGLPVWEARTLKSHIKDCASKLAKRWDLRNAKSIVANRITIRPEYINMHHANTRLVETIDGHDIRPVTIKDRLGTRTAVKIVEYVEGVHFKFDLHVLNDNIVTLAMLQDIFTYGGFVNGLGQDRTIGLGKYTFTLEEVES